ncbi:MAG: hypothetical protein MJ204_05695 [Bacteroidales bacterium]|nr:hypothetical protein [Bacteroidales bacterium]
MNKIFNLVFASFFITSSLFAQKKSLLLENLQEKDSLITAYKDSIANDKKILKEKDILITAYKDTITSDRMLLTKEKRLRKEEQQNFLNYKTRKEFICDSLQNRLNQYKKAYYSLKEQRDSLYSLISYHEGAIRGEFSVSQTRKIAFSKGNLQYQASTKTWRFAENQWDTIGEELNNKRSATYNGWIDKFAWGYTGYNNAQPYQKEFSTDNLISYETDITENDEMCKKYDFDLTDTYFDWGIYNKISNGGNVAGLWRTITRKEWDYLLYKRPNADKLYSICMVNGVEGILLLPDNWSYQSSISYIPYDAIEYLYYFNEKTYEDCSYIKNWGKFNNYNSREWEEMEKHGAVFLPAENNECVYWLANEIKGLQPGSGDVAWFFGADFILTHINAHTCWHSGYDYNDSLLYYAIRGALHNVRLIQDIK